MNEDWKESHSDRIVLLKVNICLRKILGIIGLQSVDTRCFKKNGAQFILKCIPGKQTPYRKNVQYEIASIKMQYDQKKIWQK